MRRYSELAVGVTVILALVVMVGGVLWFKGYALQRDTYELVAYFPQASGLSRGDPVEVAGVVQGAVSRIDYEQGRARITLELRRSAELYRGTVALIANYGIMGQKFISLDPGRPTGGPLDLTRPLEGRYDPGIGDMMTNVGTSLARADTLVVQLIRILAAFDSAGGAPALGRLVRNTERLTGDLAGITADTREPLRRTLRNLDAGTSELKALLEEKSPKLKGTIDNLERASARFDTLSAQLLVTNREVRTSLEQLNRNDNTAGALLQDRQLYDRLLGTVARTDSLLLDFQKNPRRYLKFSVF